MVYETNLRKQSSRFAAKDIMKDNVLIVDIIGPVESDADGMNRV